MNEEIEKVLNTITEVDCLKVQAKIMAVINEFSNGDQDKEELLHSVVSACVMASAAKKDFLLEHFYAVCASYHSTKVMMDVQPIQERQEKQRGLKSPQYYSEFNFGCRVNRKDDDLRNCYELDILALATYADMVCIDGCMNAPKALTAQINELEVLGKNMIPDNLTQMGNLAFISLYHPQETVRNTARELVERFRGNYKRSIGK